MGRIEAQLRTNDVRKRFFFRHIFITYSFFSLSGAREPDSYCVTPKSQLRTRGFLLTHIPRSHAQNREARERGCKYPFTGWLNIAFLNLLK